MIEPGELIVAVDIEQPTRNTVLGKTGTVFDKVGNTRRFQFVKQSSQEFVFAKEANSRTQHLLRGYYTTDLTTAGRFKMINDNNRLLNVVGIDNVRGGNVEMLVSCIEDATAES